MGVAPRRDINEAVEVENILNGFRQEPAVIAQSCPMATFQVGLVTKLLYLRSYKALGYRAYVYLSTAGTSTICHDAPSAKF